MKRLLILIVAVCFINVFKVYGQTSNDLKQLYSMPESKAFTDDNTVRALSIEAKKVPTTDYTDMFKKLDVTMYQNIAEMSETIENIDSSSRNNDSAEKVLNLYTKYNNAKESLRKVSEDKASLYQNYGLASKLDINKYSTLKIVDSENFDIGDIKDIKEPCINLATISTFGLRLNPDTIFAEDAKLDLNNIEYNTGVDILTLKEADVLAVFNGTVTSIDKIDENVNNVIISSSNSIQSIYCNLSEVNCKLGDKVNQYDRIGTVGNNKQYNMSVLNFKLIINGNIVNPARLF